ncbi:MAG TPA: methyl-accepting chemotaxis protein [Desulfovibrio sp.]|uniref:methyl-accepting chemotaxis protein n=1 Tax=Desulfovibrio sp. TaxID=885 RepID=UPI002D305C8C|nr:methyl-accepting chemotaxis protein [Desulfovibrio sp.]HZF62558.1 methyl-accepting chemotaxis protein [Desulfovibrio sp.]
MKLSIKLVILTVLLTAFSIIIGFISVVGMSSINKDVKDISENWLPTIKVVAEINSMVNEYRRNELVHILTTDESVMRTYENKIQNLTSSINEKVKEYEKLISEPEEKVAFPKFLAAWKAYTENHARVEVLSKSNNTEEAVKLVLGPARAQYGEALDQLKVIIDVNDKGSKSSAADAEASYERGKLITISLIIAVMLAATAISILIIRGVTKQLGEDPGYLHHVASEIAAGQLDLAFKPYSGDGGVYGVLIKMVENLKAKIAEADSKSQQAEQQAKAAQEATVLAEEATRRAERAKAEGMFQAAQQLEGIVQIVSSASEALSEQIAQSSRGADEQSGRVRETATAMEEMNATVLEVAKNAQQAADVSHQTREQAVEGSQILNEAVKGIESVHTQSIAIKEDMDALGKQAESIGQIMGVIADIADQTNLLALNAAIEAARAGDAGRGFAVVADEVRKLAEKTMTATQEVGQAITGIQAGTRKNIQNVEQVAVTIENATNMSVRSGESLKKILEFVHLVNDQVQSIATASEQQSAASEEINQSVEQVATISAETAQAMEQASGAVADLTQQAQSLQRLIEKMKNQA